MFRFSPSLRRVGVSSVLAAVLVSALATSAIASSPVPFAGSFTETATIINPPPILVANASGSGSVTPLGPSTEAFTGVVDFAIIDPKTGCALDSATGSIKAANGGTVFVTSVGEFCLATGTDSGTFYITGGTGRFHGAHGGGPYTSMVNLATGISNETYNGSISY